jgi:hypothetical protein
MKLALIGDVQTSNMAHAYGGAYKFFLAQKVKTYQPYYHNNHEYFERIRRRSNFVMLDNGTPEGTPLSYEQLLEAYNIVQPDELILPDVLENAEETLKDTFTFLKLYEEEVPPIRRMVVPQGTSVDEWEWCLDEFVSSRFAFETIGVPKHMEGKEGGRVACLQAIERRGLHRLHHVHMLGCYEQPVMEVRRAMAACPWVRGIDTAAPFAYAQAGEDIQCGKHIGYAWGKDFDEERASWNIDALLRACQGK